MSRFAKHLLSAFSLSIVAAFVAFTPFNISAQVPPTPFRVGEKVSYNLSYEQYRNVAFLEMQVISRGKFSGRDAVELRAKIKTFDLVSAAFATIDETRTVFAAADSGLPIYISRSINDGVVPKEIITNNLEGVPALDLLTLIYKVRETAGNGSFTFTEGGENFAITFASTVGEVVKTDAGDFETSVSTVQSTYFDTRGIKELKVNFTSDERHVPVQIRFKTSKGSFLAKVSGISGEEPAPTASPSPTPIVIATPKPAVTPKPTPQPPTYVNDQPLLPELVFVLGEALNYKVTQANRPVGEVTFTAKERKLINGVDSLILEARVIGTENGTRPFNLADSMTSRVNPDTLAPFAYDLKVTGPMATVSQSNIVDPRTGAITFGASRVDAPVGTHNLLSLIYAMRSFNLRPSKDATAPVNDTRVAVFWQDKPYVFTLRPSNADTITIAGEKVAAQLITINTGNPLLDSAAIKVWLSLEDSRVPLRIIVGSYQADLIIKDATPFR